MILSFIVVSATAYPGYGGNGDCNLCHNEPASSFLEGDTELTLDGLGDEIFWEEHYGRRMQIPVASQYGSNRQMVELIFAQNSTHLFVYASWGDSTINGTDSARYDDSDGFALCFNINAANFTTAYFSGMSTMNAGESVDAIIWKPAASETGQDVLPENNKVVTGDLLDTAISSTGWVAETSTDAVAVVRHGNITAHVEEHYSLELVRPLVTNDPNDVQFDTPGFHDFGIAVFNATSGASHYVSFKHTVWIGAPDDGTGVSQTVPFEYQIGLVGLGGLSLVLLVALVVKIRKS